MHLKIILNLLQHRCMIHCCTTHNQIDKLTHTKYKAVFLKHKVHSKISTFRNSLDVYIMQVKCHHIY